MVINLLIIHKIINITVILIISLRKNTMNTNDLNSILKPDTNSDSPSIISNGCRFISITKIKILNEAIIGKTNILISISLLMLIKFIKIIIKKILISNLKIILNVRIIPSTLYNLLVDRLGRRIAYPISLLTNIK